MCVFFCYQIVSVLHMFQLHPHRSHKIKYGSLGGVGSSTLSAAANAKKKNIVIKLPDARSSNPTSSTSHHKKGGNEYDAPLKVIMTDQQRLQKIQLKKRKEEEEQQKLQEQKKYLEESRQEAIEIEKSQRLKKLAMDRNKERDIWKPAAAGKKH